MKCPKISYTKYYTTILHSYFPIRERTSLQGQFEKKIKIQKLFRIKGSVYNISNIAVVPWTFDVDVVVTPPTDWISPNSYYLIRSSSILHSSHFVVQNLQTLFSGENNSAKHISNTQSSVALVRGCREIVSTYSRLS